MQPNSRQYFIGGSVVTLLLLASITRGGKPPINVDTSAGPHSKEVQYAKTFSFFAFTVCLEKIPQNSAEFATRLEKMGRDGYDLAHLVPLPDPQHQITGRACFLGIAKKEIFTPMP
jgi:hypothetical protein